MVPRRFRTQIENDNSIQFNLLPNTAKCNDSTVLITVKSSLNHFGEFFQNFRKQKTTLDNREAIRTTWSSISTKTKVVFLLGVPDDENVERAIELESREFGDILLADFIDNYQNLTLKALAGLKWRSEFCAEPDFVLSVDDDTFVDTSFLLEHIEKLPTQDFIECSERTVLKGKVWREGDWAVPESIYSQNRFPTYCNGPCYLMPKSTSEKLFSSSKSTVTDLQIDDAYVTGILRTKSEVPLIKYKRLESPGWCQERDFSQVLLVI